MTKALLEIIKRLYGSKALSKTIGTRTNVITLPDKETKKFVTQELNIEAASDAAAQKAKDDIEKLIPEIPKMNDQEILTLTGNLRRLENKINPPSAEVFEFGTKQPVSREGIASLTEQAGQKTPPGTLMGDLESRINQLRASGKSLEELTKGKGMTLEDLLQDPTRSGGPLDPKVGIVRTAAREILEKNLKAGKIDIPDEAAKDAILKSYQGGVDPIDVLRKTYGEGVLEQLDDIADELNKASDYKDMQKILQREKLFEAKPKKTYGYDEGVYSDEEMAKILTDETPDEFATGGRVGFQEGGNIYSMYQNYLNDLQNRASGDFSVPIGNMYQGTFTNQAGSAETESTQTNPVGSTFNPTFMDMLGLAINPVMGIANLASRTTTGLSLAQRAMDAFGFGRGPGGRTAGFGVDSVAGMASGPTHGVDAVNSQSVGADASAGGAAGAAAASAAGANDGPGTGGSFAQGGRVEMASGGIAALKALLNFFAKQKGKKGSDMLKEINPKRLGFLQNMLMKSDKELLDANRQEYLEELSGIIKSDKKLLDKIKQMPEEARDTFFTIANEGGNRGRLSVYKDPDFNIDDAISEIEQMKKNLKFKDVSEKEVKRQMNAEGNIDPTKEKQIKQMLKMGADESTIASITGATPQQIQFVQQQQKEKKATGGRVGYAYGSGLKLIKLLKQKGTSLKKAIQEAVENINKTGDSKLDADMAVDDMLETYNIDRDAVDGYDILNAYDQAYKNIAREKLINRIKKVNPEVDISIDISDPETASDFAKFAKQNDPKGYKKIEKIVDDVNNKNKAITKNAENELIQARKNVAQSQDFVGDDVKYDARLLAEELALVRLKTNYEDLDLDTQLNLFDESYNHLLDLIQERGQIKGAIDVRSGKNILTGKQEMKPEALPGEDLITPKKRTLNASGGLAYLMGL